MENWIKDAFQEAGKEADVTARAEKIMRKFMDEESSGLLESWMKIEEVHHVHDFSVAMNNPLVNESVMSLCAQFFINGWLRGYGVRK